MECLRRYKFGKKFSDLYCLRLARRIRVAHYEAGDTIFEAGTEMEGAFYFLREGKVHTQQGSIKKAYCRTRQKTKA